FSRDWSSDVCSSDLLPKKVINTITNNALINSLYFTDIGFFPKAKNHYIQRQKESKQYILIYCKEGHGMVQINKKNLLLKPNTFRSEERRVGKECRSR